MTPRHPTLATESTLAAAFYPDRSVKHVVIALSEHDTPVKDVFAALGVEPRAIRRQVERLLANPWTARPVAEPGAPDAAIVARFDAELSRLTEEFHRLRDRMGPPSRPANRHA